MLNICFSESAMGSIKFAFHKYAADYHSNVICIPDDLSIGNISNVRDFNSRKDTLVSLFGDEKYVDSKCKSRYQEFFDEIYNHQEITIWYGNSPFEFCGFLYTIWLLKDKPITIKGIYCSRTMVREPNTYVTYKHAGELDPDRIDSFLSYAKEIADKDKKDYADLWERLSMENGELRIYKDSTIITTDVSFYDEIILKHISFVSVPIAKIIGKIFGQEQLVIGDGFIAMRINELIKRGVLKQEGSDERFYRNNIRKLNY